MSPIDLINISPPQLLSLIKQQTDSPEEQLASIIDASKKSLRHFAWYAVAGMTDWRQVKQETDDDGNVIPSAYQEAWHVLSWYWMLERYSRLCILCARGFHKTGTFSWVYPLWRIWKDPGIDGLLISNAEAQAAENLDVIKKIVEANTILRELKPARPRNWATESIECANGSSLSVRGAGSATRGLHPGFCVLDDILDERNSSTPDLRKKVTRWVGSVIEPMMLGKSQLFIVGTPQAYDDCLMSLKGSREYVWLRYPAEMTASEYKELGTQLDPSGLLPEDPGEEPILLWPSKFGRKFLDSKKEKIDQFLYAQEYLCNPLPEGSQVFQREWLKYYSPEHLLDGGKGIQLPGEEPAYFKAVYMGVDLAISEKQRADYFATVVIGVTKSRIFVLHASHDKISFKRQAERIRELNTRFKPDIIGIEAVAYQAALPQYLMDETLLPIKRLTSTKSKEVRARRASVHFENGQVYLREDQIDLIGELMQFPAGAHDDLVDALGFCLTIHAGRTGTKSKVSGVRR